MVPTIQEQQLACTTDLLLCEAPDYIGTLRIKHGHNFHFIFLFVSSRLGMCDRLNPLVCTVIRGSLICLINVPHMLAEFCFI